MVDKKQKKAALTRGELWELQGSSIHQQGMFARKAIAGGTRIIEYLGERVQKEISNERALAWEAAARKKGEGMVYVFELDEAYDLDGNIPNNPAKYINHSCSENCEAVNEDNRIFIYSLRDIEKGEELLFDYGYGLEHFLDHPCRCGADNCVGYIVAKADRPKLKQLLKARAARRKKAAAKKKSAVTSEKKGTLAAEGKGALAAGKKKSATDSAEAGGAYAAPASKKGSRK